MADDLIRSYANHFGLKAAIVRVFSSYGVGLRKQLWWDACQKVQRGETQFLGTGSETRDWVAIEDIAELLLIAGERASTDAPVVNGATGVEVTISETLSELFRALETHQKPRFSGVRRPGDPARYAGDPSRALAWGWNPRGKWREGVAEYGRWFLSTVA